MKNLYSIFCLLFVLANVWPQKTNNKNLKLVLSIENQFKMAQNALNDSINHFKITNQHINLAHDLLNSDDYLVNEKKLCNLVDSHSPLLIFEAFNHPKMSNNRLKLLARNVGITMISELVDELDDSKMMNEEWINLNDLEKKFLISYQLPTKSLTRSIFSLANYFAIKKAVVFTDNDLDHHFDCLLSGHKQLDLTIELIKNYTIDEMYEQIKAKKRQNFLSFFIVSHSKLINLFLESFRRNDLFQKPFELIVISKDQGKVKCSLCKHGKFIVLKPIPSIYEYESAPLNRIKSVVKNELDYFFYYDLMKWILASFSQILLANQWKSDQQFKTCSLPGSNHSISDVPLIDYMLNDQANKYARFGVLRISSELNSQLKSSFVYQEISAKIISQEYRANHHIEKTIAEWEYSLPTGSVMITAKQEEGDEEDETGDEEDDGPLKVLLYLTPPFVTKRVVNNSQTVYEGFLIDLLDEIKRLLGDKLPPFELQETPAASLGLIEQFEDDIDRDSPTLTGLLREIQDSEMKGFALAPMVITESREMIVDFSEPIFDSVGISVLMKKPARQSNTWRFISVLDDGVWVSVTAAYFFTSILLAIFDRFSPYSFRNRPEKYANDEDKRIFTLKETFWFCFISLTPQGGGDAPKCISGRLVAAIWWLLGFIFTASYTANLAAFLTVSRLNTHVDSMATLSKQYKIRYSAVENSQSDAYFVQMAYIEDKYYEIWKNLSLDDDLTETERANLAVWEYPISDIYTKIKAQMVEARKPKSLEEGVKRVRASNLTNSFALLSTTLDVEYFAHLFCDVFRAGDDFAHNPIALPMAKEAKSLKKLIDPIIKKLKNNGFVEKLKVRYWYSKRHRTQCGEYRSLSNGLTLFNTYGIFIIFGIGMVSTLVIIGIENWFITRLHKKKCLSEQTKNMANIAPRKS